MVVGSDGSVSAYIFDGQERGDPFTQALPKGDRAYHPRPKTATLPVAFRVRFRIDGDEPGVWRVTVPMFEVDAVTTAKRLGEAPTIKFDERWPTGVEEIEGWDLPARETKPVEPKPEQVKPHVAGAQLLVALTQAAAAEADYGKVVDYSGQLYVALQGMSCTEWDEAVAAIREMSPKFTIPTHRNDLHHPSLHE